MTTTSVISSDYIDPTSPIFNEIQTESSRPMHWHECQQFVRERMMCAGGCGKFILVSRTRCHNVYMCDNCGSARMRAWLFLSQRDPSALRLKEQTGVELSLPRQGSLLADDLLIRSLLKQLAGDADRVGMPILDPKSSETKLRLSLVGRHNWHTLNARWKELTGGKGTLTLYHYSPAPGVCYTQFLEWVFRGMEPLAQLTELERLVILDQFEGSRRLLTHGDFYSPLPKWEQRALRDAQKAAKLTHLCPCCGNPLDKIPEEEQETLPIDKMQEKYPDRHIAYEEVYDPFHARRRDVSIGQLETSARGKGQLRTMPTHSPPS